MTEDSAPDTLHFGYNWDSCYFCTFPSPEETRNHGTTLDMSASLKHHIPCKSYFLPAHLGYKHFLGN